MKTRIFHGCAILALCLTSTQMIVSAQETPGLEGTWMATVTARNCQSGAPLVTFRALNMFIHDGSLTEASAFMMASPLRSNSLGAWQHAQGHTYTSTFRFFRYNPDGSFLEMRKITRSIELNGDLFTSSDVVEVFDWNNNLTSTGCSTEIAARVQ